MVSPKINKKNLVTNATDNPLKMLLFLLCSSIHAFTVAPDKINANQLNHPITHY
jgi:hypothetical protein